MNEWLYIRMYPAAPEGMDDLVSGVVGALDLNAAHRWFWLRYIDQAGFHVRLRALVAPSRATQVLADAEDRLPSSASLTLGVYQPEYQRYGGREGLAVAERLFQKSSTICLDLVRDLPAGRARLAVAAAIMRTAVATTLSGPAPSAHYKSVSEYWRAPPAAPARAAVQAAVPCPELGDWLAGLAAPPPDVTQESWLFHHVHLTMNRLGVTPAQEGALAAVLSEWPPELTL